MRARFAIGMFATVLVLFGSSEGLAQEEEARKEGEGGTLRLTPFAEPKPRADSAPERAPAPRPVHRSEARPEPRPKPRSPGEIAADCSTPARTLVELARDFDLSVRKAVAVNPGTPAEALRTLAQDFDPTVRAAVARHWSTPPDVLSGLAGDVDRDVRLKVMANPSTPGEVVVHQLAVDPELLRRSNVLARMPVEDLRAVASESDDWEGLDWRWFGSNPNMPPDIIRELYRDKKEDLSDYGQLRAVILHNLRSPVDVLRQIAGEMPELWSSLDLSDLVLFPEALSWSMWIVAHPNSPEDFVRRFAVGWTRGFDDALESGLLGVPRDIREEFLGAVAEVRHEAEYIFEMGFALALAGQPATPPDVLDYIAKRRHSRRTWHEVQDDGERRESFLELQMTIDSLLLANPSLPADALAAILSEYPDSTVPLDLRSREHGEFLREFLSHLPAPPMPAEVQRRLAMRGHATAVAAEPDSPADLLRRLAGFSAASRLAVAGNPSAPADLLERLAAESEELAGAVALNSSAPADLLRRLAAEGHAREVATNPSAPTELLRELTRKPASCSSAARSLVLQRRLEAEASVREEVDRLALADIPVQEQAEREIPPN